MKNDSDVDYRKMAFDLQTHIRNYKPGSWQYPIGNVAFVPAIMPDDFEKLDIEYGKNNLKNYISSSGKRYLVPWYVQEAIMNFFDERYKNYNS